MPDTLVRGLTPRQFARLYQFGRERVIAMLKRGELGGVKVPAGCGRVTYRIMPHHVAAWEQSHGAAEPAPGPRRRKRSMQVDYFPD